MRSCTPTRVPLRLALLVLLVSLTCPGCVAATAQLMYILRGEKVQADFDGLQAKRVAVVSVSHSSAMGPGSETQALAQAVAVLLKHNVKDIELVHPDEVADWMDNNDWDQLDYREVGQGVRCDMLLAIELDSFRLYDGATMFRGQADVRVMLFDMSRRGEVVWEREIDDFSFPSNGGHHTADSTEARFRRVFISHLARRIGRFFYAYDLVEEFAPDADQSGL